jgi:hypothetical protein
LSGDHDNRPCFRIPPAICHDPRLNAGDYLLLIERPHPAGDQFDAFSALGKVLSQATGDVVMVDPYMDEVTLTDFLPLVSEGVSIRLLSDAHSVKPTLKPAVGKWQQQYGDVRPLSAKLSAPRSLHDRLIILDSSSAWILTQSLKDFAARSPGSIAKVDAEAASLKVRAYEAMWTSATDL